MAYPAPTMSNVLRIAPSQMQGSEGSASIPASPEPAHAIWNRARCAPCCTSRSPPAHILARTPSSKAPLKLTFLTRTTSSNGRPIRSTPRMRTGNSTLSRGSLRRSAFSRSLLSRSLFRRSLLAESKRNHRTEALEGIDRVSYFAVITSGCASCWQLAL
jgi:hypothetical protein